MTIMKLYLFLTFAFCLLPMNALAQSGSAIRITCSDDNASATVYINDIPKGECPLDIMVKPGTISIRAFKKYNNHSFGEYKKSINLGADVVQRIDINLEKKLTPAGEEFLREKYTNELNEYKVKLAVREADLMLCEQNRENDLIGKYMHCYTYGPGCTGGLFICEEDLVRRQRCAREVGMPFIVSNGRLYYDDKAIKNQCSKSLPLPAEPINPLKNN